MYTACPVTRINSGLLGKREKEAQKKLLLQREPASVCVCVFVCVFVRVCLCVSERKERA